MRFYKKPHEFYCGIDLHTKKMYCCLVDAAGNKLVHRNIDTRGDRFLNLVDPYRDGLVVGAATNLRSVPDVLLVLAGRPLRRREHPVRAGTRAVHESHSRRENQERQN